MERHEQEFNVFYTYRLEKYLYTFWRRLNTLVVFLQIYLSTMIFASVAGSHWYGAIMAALTIGAFVLNISEKIANARTQFTEYSQLRLNIKKLSDEELTTELIRIKSHDSDPLGCLENPAYNRATIEYGQPDYVGKLTWFESCMAWISGDLPKHPAN